MNNNKLWNIKSLLIKFENIQLENKNFSQKCGLFPSYF